MPNTLPILRSVIFSCFFTCLNMELHSTEIVESSFNSHKAIWKSNDQKEIIPLIQEQLKNLKETNNYPLLVSFDESKEYNEEILKRNRYIRGYNNRSIQLTFFDKSNTTEEIGRIELTLQKGTDHMFQKWEKEFLDCQKENSKVAHLDFIEIYSQHQGKGYGSIALKIAHDFLDKIGTNFSFLENTSKQPYSGMMYKKAGYFCAPKLLEEIIDWGEKNGITSDQAENEFWKDTSKECQLKNTRRLHMIRHNPNN